MIHAPKGENGSNGTAAGFGTPTASATSLPPGSIPTVSITPTGPNTAKIFNFTFGIPRGDTGPSDSGGSGGGVPSSGGTITGNLTFSDSGIGSKEIEFITGGNDYAKIIGGATTLDNSGGGYLELRTGDNGDEGIWVTQYEGDTRKNLLYLLDSEGDTRIPNNLIVTKSISANSLILEEPLPIRYGGTGRTSNILIAADLSKQLSTTTVTNLFDSEGIKNIPINGILQRENGGTGISVTTNADLLVGIGAVNKEGDTITGTLTLSKTTDASGITNNSPALIIGGTDTTAHIEIDKDKILAKSNGTTPTVLNLNRDGGGISVGNGNIITKIVFTDTDPGVNSNLATGTLLFVYE